MAKIEGQNKAEAPLKLKASELCTSQSTNLPLLLLIRSLSQRFLLRTFLLPSALPSDSSGSMAKRDTHQAPFPLGIHFLKEEATLHIVVYFIEDRTEPVLAIIIR